MQESIDSIEFILEKTNLFHKEKLENLLKETIRISDDSSQRENARHKNLVFRIEIFFKGLNTIINHLKKEDRLLKGVEATELVFTELGFEVDKVDAFILYHIRNLGKFRMKESKLYSELKSLWGEHKEYELSEIDLTRTLKQLMRMGIINYRKGNFTLKQSMLIRYKNN